MAWLELRFTCDAELAEAWSDALLAGGALSASIEDADAGDAREQAIFGEPGAAPPGVWRRNAVCALIDAHAQPGDLLRAAARDCGASIVPAYAVRAVPERDWVRETQAQFEPFRVSPRLWIVPSWHAPPDPAALVVRVDPGLAFGTGSHATTRLCLRWLDAHLRPGESLLDYGCGSGILAIAAARLGARPVVAADIDPQAVAAARANATANACDIDVRDTRHSLGRDYAVVVANILANPLRVLAPALAGHVLGGGRLVLSGILAAQADDLIACYAPWIALSAFDTEDGWTCLHGSKPR
jgi:ribosomal protein L11 methyltransferase